MAQVVRRLRELRLSAQAIVFIILVTGGLTGFCVNFRMQKGATTGEHMRQIKQMLVIYSAQNGGFPANLDELGRMGPAPSPSQLVDGWDRPIVYTVRNPFPAGEMGRTAYADCELRSAGPNGRVGDGDDVVWVGKEDAGPPPQIPMGEPPMGGPIR
jgi:hypothetical protein